MNDVIQNEDGSVTLVYDEFTVTSFYPAPELLETLRGDDE